MESFFAIFISNQIVGNVSAAILLSQGIETDVVFIILAIVATIGIFGFWILRPASQPHDNSVNGESKNQTKAIFEVLLLIADKRAALLAMIMVYSGITQTFFTGTLPLFINNYGNEDAIDDKSLKLYLMAVFGTANAIGSLLMGKLSDRFGRHPILVFGGTVQFIGYMVLLLKPALNDLAILIPVAAMFGIGDAVLNTQVYGILGFVFVGSSEAAFACFKFYQSASSGILFFVGSYMLGGKDYCPEENKCPNMAIWFPVLVAPLILGVGGVLAFTLFSIPIDLKSRDWLERRRGKSS